jgi:Bacterial toxin 46
VFAAELVVSFEPGHGLDDHRSERGAAAPANLRARCEPFAPAGVMAMTALDRWLEQWTHKSRSVQDRVQVALDFFWKHFGTGCPDRILSEMKCIDFSHSVDTPMIPRGITLVGSKDPRVSPYRAVYFTTPGHPADRLGIAPSGNLSTNPTVMDKVQYRYQVLVTIPPGECLQSTCAPAADTWSVQGQKILAGGGGLQYLIPKMNRYLRFVA